jgi:hypothetical protein
MTVSHRNAASPSLTSPMLEEGFQLTFSLRDLQFHKES